jgi:hypothetical protein
MPSEKSQSKIAEKLEEIPDQLLGQAPLIAIPVIILGMLFGSIAVYLFSKREPPSRQKN